jgi:uncharacterized membrane protein YccC
MAFGLAQTLTLPLHGLWAVLTAVIVTQLSVGASLSASAEYVLGTLCGAAYASSLGLLVPHTSVIALAAVLALAVAPLAYAATLSPIFRIAPFTAVMVLLLARQFGEGPIEAGLYRLLEVALGGAVAVMVSLFVFPQRAHGLGRDAASRMIEQFAQALPQLLAGLTRQFDESALRRIQDDTDQTVASLQAILAEAGRERFVSFVRDPDPGPMSRTLLRVRHDLIMIGRAALAPFSEELASRLEPLLRDIAASSRVFLLGNARALASQDVPPSPSSVNAALESYAAEIARLRRQGVVRTLPSAELERLFALSFALDQLHQHFLDLARCVEEWAGHSRAEKGNSAPAGNAVGEITGAPLVLGSGRQAIRRSGVKTPGEVSHA